jgi:hypothetical protein
VRFLFGVYLPCIPERISFIRGRWYSSHKVFDLTIEGLQIRVKLAVSINQEPERRLHSSVAHGWRLVKSFKKMLGYTNLKTAQYYAKNLDIKVRDNMEAIEKESFWDRFN